jgi:hypothetical protein
VRIAGERVDVQRLHIPLFQIRPINLVIFQLLPVDPVADPAQPRMVA